MKELLLWYHGLADKTLELQAVFHARYEAIHPFQDGNGRTGRLILFRECLKAGLTPVIIEDMFRMEYIEGLKEFRKNGTVKLLMDLFLREQEEYNKKAAYFSGEDQ